LGRSATESEVADYLSMNPDDVKKVLDESNTFNVVCLDEILVDRMKSNELVNNRGETPEEKFETHEMKEILAGCIEKLNEKEQMVISLYYHEEMTLKEIGLTLGVSESRVSQIHSKAILSLKGKIKQALPYG
jgi:RNA polymerase sigma factor for flagellar operon FliA